MERKLELKENDYKSLLEMLHTYEKNLKLNETNVSNTIKHGLSRDSRKFD